MIQEAQDIRETERGLVLDVTIRLPNGLHSRPSARLAQAARKYRSNIHLLSHEGEVDAKSVLDILSLALKCNDGVRLLAKGPDASAALRELAAILAGSGV